MNLSWVLGKHPTGVTRLPEELNTADKHANVVSKHSFPLSAIFMDFLWQKKEEKRKERKNISLLPSTPFHTDKRFVNGFLSSLHPANFIATATLAQHLWKINKRNHLTRRETTLISVGIKRSTLPIWRQKSRACFITSNYFARSSVFVNWNLFDNRYTCNHPQRSNNPTEVDLSFS